jgi:site-specific recombinase XerD
MQSPVRGRKFAKEAYTVEEMNALLAVGGRSATSTRNRALYALMWQSGARIAEALALMPIDFDLDAAQIHIRRGKGNKSRRVAVGPRAVEETRAWIVKRSALSLEPDAPLFCTLQGRPMHDTYVRTAMQRTAAKAQWQKRAHPHALRHSFAIQLARSGVPVPYIMRALGHASLEVTSVYLSAISTEDVSEAMRSVDWG